MVSHELRHMPENKHYIDGHTHLENGDLSKDTVYAFIQAAINKGLKHIQILDHTHRFYEFKDMYEEICKIDVQREWFEKKQKNSIKEYHALIEEIRQEEFPIQVSFGLEVCYMPGYEDFLKPLLTSYPYDFLVGSVHSVDGYLFFVGGILLTLIGILMGGSLLLTNISGMMVLIYLAFVSACAYTLWGILLSYHPVSKIGIFKCLIPVVGVLLSSLILHEEAFSMNIVFALIFISFGIYFVSKEKDPLTMDAS